MPAVKVKRASSAVDMTAMTDVAFLLLTFFILTAKFKSEDATPINTPSSISVTKVPEKDIMTIAIDSVGKVYFGVDKPAVRVAMLDALAKSKGVTFTEKEQKEFSLMQNFGLPFGQLKGYMALSTASKGSFKQVGIPTDSTGAGKDNELASWVYQARLATNNGLKIAVKGDKLSKFPTFKNVLATLQAQDINKFNLITGTENPGGMEK